MQGEGVRALRVARVAVSRVSAGLFPTATGVGEPTLIRGVGAHAGHVPGIASSVRGGGAGREDVEEVSHFRTFAALKRTAVMQESNLLRSTYMI